MEIIRKFDDGTEIRTLLTDSEIGQAYRERRSYYNKCDLIHRINIMLDSNEYEDHLQCADDQEFEIGKRTVTGKQLKELIEDDAVMNDMIDEFESGLDSNDSYWESFWTTADTVIEDMINERIPKSEKELKQDANREKYKTLIAEIQRSPLSYSAKAEMVNKLINEGAS